MAALSVHRPFRGCKKGSIFTKLMGFSLSPSPDSSWTTICWGRDQNATGGMQKGRPHSYSVPDTIKNMIMQQNNSLASQAIFLRRKFQTPLFSSLFSVSQTNLEDLAHKFLLWFRALSIFLMRYQLHSRRRIRPRGSKIKKKKKEGRTKKWQTKWEREIEGDEMYSQLLFSLGLGGARCIRQVEG